MARKKKSGAIARELEVSGALCLAFANTAVPRRDDRRRASPPRVWTPFDTYGDVVAWGGRMGSRLDVERLSRAAAERPKDAAGVLARALALRLALLRIFTALAFKESARPEDMRTLNAELARALPSRRLVVQGTGFGWDWESGDGALDRMLWPVAQSAADLMTSDAIRRLRQCGTTGCNRIFIDRRGRRVWCDMNTCGSRAKGRRQQRRGLQGLKSELYAAKAEIDYERMRRDSAQPAATDDGGPSAGGHPTGDADDEGLDMGHPTDDSSE